MGSSRYPSDKLVLALLLAVVPVLFLSGCSDSATAVSTEDSQTESEAMTSSARVAYVDPDTGKLTYKKPRTRSGREPLQLDPQFVESISLRADTVKFSESNDGMITAEKPGGFRSAYVATIDADGKLQTTHVTAGAPEEQEVDDAQ